MLRLQWKLLLIFFLITCTSTLAKAQLLEYGTALCGDTVSFYCHTVGMTTTTVEVKTNEGVNLKEKEVLETWELLWGNTVERHIIMNINRRNTPLKKGDEIAIPCDMAGKTFMDFSPYPLKIEPTGSKFLIWDPGLLAYGAYDAEGNLIRWGAGVGGKDYCPDVKRGCRTKTGEFRIISKQGPSYRSGRYPIGCSGKKCALMPYAMFFASGYAFHTGKVPGVHASHGCVRLFAEDAKWLNQNFVEVGMRVIIKPYPQISIIRIVAPIISGLFFIRKAARVNPRGYFESLLLFF